MKLLLEAEILKILILLYQPKMSKICQYRKAVDALNNGTIDKMKVIVLRKELDMHDFVKKKWLQ